MAPGAAGNNKLLVQFGNPLNHRMNGRRWGYQALRSALDFAREGESFGFPKTRGLAMEMIVPILVQLVGGGVGGNVIGQIVKQLNLGPVGNSIAGAIGGLAATWLAARIPGLEGLVNGAATAAADGGAAVGGLDFGALAGQGVTGLVGGGVLTAIAGLIKNATSK